MTCTQPLQLSLHPYSPTHPLQTPQLCQYLLCFCRLVPVHHNSNERLPAGDAQYIQLWNHCGEPAGSPSKHQSQAFAHVCMTFPLLFQNKVLKQQGEGSVNGSASVPRNHQPCCFQLCSRCCNQWKHLAVMSTYRQEKTPHPLCHGCIFFQTNQWIKITDCTRRQSTERIGA